MVIAFRKPAELARTPTAQELQVPAWGRPIDAEDAEFVEAILVGLVRVDPGQEIEEQSTNT